MQSDLTPLVERCRQGDALAWEQLVRRCQGRVYALAYHYLGNVEEARDLTQEAFVRVYQQADKSGQGSWTSISCACSPAGLRRNADQATKIPSSSNSSCVAGRAMVPFGGAYQPGSS